MNDTTRYCSHILAGYEVIAVLVMEYNKEIIKAGLTREQHVIGHVRVWSVVKLVKLT